MVIGKNFVVTMIILLSTIGCAMSLYKKPVDYIEADFSRIRVLNGPIILEMTIYEESNGCYKEGEHFSLSSGVIFFNTRPSKKVSGMLPPSQELQNKNVQEFIVKANQKLEILYGEQTYSTQYYAPYDDSSHYTNYISDTHFYTFRFSPEVGHDYDIYPISGGIKIIDLTSNTLVQNNWGKDKECKYKNWFWEPEYIPKRYE